MKSRPSELSMLIFSSLLVGAVFAFLARQVDHYFTTYVPPARIAKGIENGDTEQLGLHLQISVGNGQPRVCMQMTSTAMFRERVANRQQNLQLSDQAANHLFYNFWLLACSGAENRRVRLESLGVRKIQDESVVCFRRIDRDDQLDYFFLKVRKNDLGRARIYDAYSLATGEWISTIVSDANEVVRSSADFEAFNAAAEAITMAKDRAYVLLNRRNYPSAHQALSELPSIAMADPVVAHMRWTTARRVGRETFLAVMPKLLPLLPANAKPIARMYLYEAQGRVDEALEAIDDIDKIVGGDPFLNYHRAKLIRTIGGRQDEAVKLLEKVVKNHHDIWTAHILLLRSWIEKRDAAQVERVLLLIEERFLFDYDAWKEKPEMQWFIQSPGYAAFERKREEIIAPRREFVGKRVDRIVKRENVVNRELPEDRNGNR